MGRYPELDLSRVRTVSIRQRHSKVREEFLGRLSLPEEPFSSFWDSLPAILKAADLQEFCQLVARAVRRQKPVIWMMGAHFIKCGLSPILIKLMHKGAVSAIAMNGAGAIHDVELTYWGHTSEDVAQNLQDGSFGMVKETAEILNETVRLDRNPEAGFGEILGQRIVEDRPKNAAISLLGNAYRLGIPVTVHVAIGTDIVHQHPNASGAAIGERSLRDFRILAKVVSDLDGGGVVIHIGSTVILPEVFLKALTVARNLGYTVDHFYTANFDMIQHYRPRMNVVVRPTAKGGKGFQFTGHHEIMIPLLASGILLELKRLQEPADE